MGVGAFGCRIFRYLGVTHARRLGPGIGRSADAADSFGSTCDTNSKCSAGCDCVVDVGRDYGVAKATAGDGSINRYNTGNRKHLGARAKINFIATNAGRRSSSYARAAGERCHARRGAHVDCTRVRVGCGRLRIGYARLHVGCIWLPVRTAREPGCRERSHRPSSVDGYRKARRLTDAHRHQAPGGASRNTARGAVQYFWDVHAHRDVPQASSEIGDTNRAAGTARTARCSTGSQGATTAG